MSKKLSKEDVEEIIEMYKGEEKISAIALKYGVTVWAIHYHIRINRNLEPIECPTPSYHDYLNNRILELKRKHETAGERERHFIELEIKRTQVAKKISKFYQ